MTHSATELGSPSAMHSNLEGDGGGEQEKGGPGTETSSVCESKKPVMRLAERQRLRPASLGVESVAANQRRY